MIALMSSTTRFKLCPLKYKTLTISHVKERTFEKHLNYIPKQIYCILEYIYILINKKWKPMLIKKSFHAHGVTIN